MTDQPDLDFTPPENHPDTKANNPEIVKMFTPAHVTPQAHARRTDPQTSKDAAASVRGISKVQAAIMDIFTDYGKLHDEALIEKYREREKTLGYPPHSDSGIRSRRSSLCDAGLLRSAGYMAKTRLRRNSAVWEIVK